MKVNIFSFIPHNPIHIPRLMSDCLCSEAESTHMLFHEDVEPDCLIADPLCPEFPPATGEFPSDMVGNLELRPFHGCSYKQTVGHFPVVSDT